VAASNADFDKFKAYAKSNSDATNAQVASEVTPLYNDLVTFGRSILQQSWPLATCAVATGALRHR